MSGEQTEPNGPDFGRGVALSELADGGMLAGHVQGKPVLVARHGDDVFAIGATCTHYGGPLGKGLRIGDTVRCPWHHACFSLRTGEALRAPALNPVARWAVEQRDGMLFVTSELPAGELPATPHREVTSDPPSVVIVGTGAAGNAAAERLRREGYQGPLTMIGPEHEVPYDRPNLSKDYLAGTASEDWIPLHPAEFYEERKIRLLLGRRVTSIDTSGCRVELDDGSSLEFGALLLAAGAEPVRLPTPVSGERRVHYLRTHADSREIIDAARDAHRAVVIGGSFIGLEVAASLRTRGLEVHVVAPEQRPLERVLGPELGDFVRRLHESHGVVFHLGHTVNRIDADSVTLDDGAQISAEVVVAGIGVHPRTELAERARLTTERGVVVDEYLETSAPGIFAAGDIARYPDIRHGGTVRIEHWVVAERQGQRAACNILGWREPFADVPFFWSQHYDVAINYVGHAEQWDEVRVVGDLEQRDCTVSYLSGGQTLAVATVGRDRESLEAELAMERGDEESLAALHRAMPAHA
jgi:NADPH-dependent 2,4-dienoyl-CoA reductase/sulfur reductase-like enzyme/nitrite reductase/ring-hydroxylating ferredoxin subunit